MTPRLPDIDIPVDFIAWTDIDKEILSHYVHPCRIHACIFVLCLEGELTANINLIEYKITKNRMIVLMPGTIIQFRSLTDDLQIHFVGFSNRFFIEAGGRSTSFEFAPLASERPVLTLRDDIMDLMRQFISLLHQSIIKERLQDREMQKCIFTATMHAVRKLYHDDMPDEPLLGRSEAIFRELMRQIMTNFEKQRRVSFYASRLNITPQHLSITVRKVTGKTVSEVIAEVVVTDAKAKLKSTSMSIQEISDSLSFPNSSFFGKYFKRYAGMSPKEYRMI